MAETLQTLQRKMENAARALDFGEAKRCRDNVSLMAVGAIADEADQADLAGLERQRPGSMGLGAVGSDERLRRNDNNLQSPDP